MSTNLEEVKAILIGESEVGKTNIISQFTKETFNAKAEETVGAEFDTKEVFYDSFCRTLKFQVWDTAGAERYRQLTKIFCRDAQIAILVYDVTSESSLTQLKEFWYDTIKSCGKPDAILAIVGNKCDIQLPEEVLENEGKAFAEQVDADFYLTSAKDNIGITDLFYELGKKYLNKKHPI